MMQQTRVRCYGCGRSLQVEDGAAVVRCTNLDCNKCNQEVALIQASQLQFVTEDAPEKSTSMRC